MARVIVVTTTPHARAVDAAAAYADSSFSFGLSGGDALGEHPLSPERGRIDRDREDGQRGIDPCASV